MKPAHMWSKCHRAFRVKVEKFSRIKLAGNRERSTNPSTLSRRKLKLIAIHKGPFEGTKVKGDTSKQNSGRPMFRKVDKSSPCPSALQQNYRWDVCIAVLHRKCIPRNHFRCSTHTGLLLLHCTYDKMKQEWTTVPCMRDSLPSLLVIPAYPFSVILLSSANLDTIAPQWVVDLY